MIPTPLPVSTGFTWTAAGAWGTFITAWIGLATLFLKQVGPWRKQTTDAEASLRQELRDDNRRLEKRLAVIEQKLEEERKGYRLDVARIQARAAAQRSLDRHRFANSESSFDALLLLLETAENLPERLLSAIAKVREQRLRQRDTEKQEAAIIHAAEIRAVEEASAAFEREAAAAPATHS